MNGVAVIEVGDLPPPLLTATQLAKELRIDNRTVRLWRTMDAGMPYEHNGASYRYDAAAVRAWLVSQGMQIKRPIGRRKAQS